VDHDNPPSFIYSHPALPVGQALVQSAEEPLPVLREDWTVGRPESGQRGLDVAGDRPRVLGIEPVMRVAEAVHVGRAALTEPWRLGLEQLDVSRDVEVVPVTGRVLVSGGGERPREPGLVIEPDANQEIGSSKGGDLSGLEIDRVRILKR